MKKTILSSIAIAAFAVTGSVFAQTMGVPATGSTDVRATTMWNTNGDSSGVSATVSTDVRATTTGHMNADSMRRQHEQVKFSKEMREEHKASSTEAREIRKASSTEMRADQKKIDKEHVGKAGIERANAVIKRLNHKIAKMEKLAVRIAERLVVLKAKGVNTTESEAKLVEARVAMNAAKTQVTAINRTIQTVLTTATSTTNVNNEMKVLAPQIREVEKSIRNANKALRDAMKVLGPKHTTTATSTTSTTTTTR